MFVDLPAPGPAGRAITEEPLSRRLARLTSRRRRVAWLYESPDTSTFRYRVQNMIEGLLADEALDVSATWFSAQELSALESVLPKIDVLVLARYRYSAELHRVVLRARNLGTRILFDCDDLVFDTRYAALVADTLAQDLRSTAIWDFWFAYMGRLNATARLCDAGIATNPFLAARLHEALEGKPVHVVPNFLNREQQAYSRALINAKRANRWARTGDVTLGYFSGSPSHNKDFAVAAPAIARLMDRRSDVRLRIAGYLDAIGPVGKHSQRVELLPLMGYVELQRAIAEVEINIAPLQENTFTHCKSELKYFEAAAVGSWTIATPTSAFRTAIHPDGSTGRLACAYEWDEALEEAVELALRPADYVERAERAAHSAHERYAWDGYSRAICSALFDAQAVERPTDLAA